MQNTIEKIRFLNERKKIGSLCCAPFTSIYFGHKGIISACCANRTKILGIYPEKNLDEIWNGKEYNEMRQELESFKFSTGCDQCKRLFRSNNFSSLKIPLHDIKEKNYNELKYPYKIHFELDNKCNLMCSMCHGKFSSKILELREKKPKYISPYLTDKFFEELKPFLDNAGLLDFYGGEPFLIDIYLKIFDYVAINNPTVQIYIQSNGTIASKKVLNYVKKLNISLSLSIDSVVKETYEQIRIGANFDSVVKNVNLFHNILRKNNKQFYMSPILCNLNYMELLEFYNFCNRYEMKLYFHDLTSPMDMSVYVLDYSELSKNIIVLEDKFKNIIPNTEIEIYNYEVIQSQIKHLKYVCHSIVKNKKEEIKFSIAEFLKINFPEYYNMYIKKINENNITDELLSKSIVFASMQEKPENFLYKKIIKSTEKDVIKSLDTFINNEKTILNRSNT